MRPDPTDGSPRRPRRVLAVVGARPNFVKVAPVLHALDDVPGIETQILHTGQHYDRALSGSFIEQLGMRPPDFHLGIGSGTHAEQTAAVLVGVERVLAEHRPDAIVVPGDVNSSLGAALAAAKAGVPVVHVESGLRSRDWTMPEEINRAVVDRISDLLLCHSDEAVDNLAAEGIAGARVAMVGNTMIDSLFRLLSAATATRAPERHGLTPGGYALVTLHRPALVDDPRRLGAVITALDELAESLPVVLPLHPRTWARLEGRAVVATGRLTLVEPLEYLDFVGLEAAARLVVTDSGGVQEETSALGVPCLTYRENTERPVTITHGTNRLVGMDPGALLSAARELLARPISAEPAGIPFWDGQAGSRAAAAVIALLDGEVPSAALSTELLSDAA
jgi:UDP-N-acetylglucosamine 2-epimerase (non-hydrolysing)